MTATTDDDTLTGTLSNDVIDGLAGNDLISGDDGEDYLRGGGGGEGGGGGVATIQLTVEQTTTSCTATQEPTFSMAALVTTPFMAARGAIRFYSPPDLEMTLFTISPSGSTASTLQNWG